MSGRLRIGCCAETIEPNWRWVADALASEALDWTFFSNVPRNAVERVIRRPRLSRYRACRELAAAAVAGRFDLVITHHPLVSCWTELFCRRRRPCPHVAFAFNFTRLPRIPRRSVMRRAFSSVDGFVVFSEFERSLYARYFQIPVARFEMIHWGVREPEGATAADASTLGESNSDAICAVGSQARDYATLLEAMRRLPQIRLILVATAANLRDLKVPPNVTVRSGYPASRSRGGHSPITLHGPAALALAGSLRTRHDGHGDVLFASHRRDRLPSNLRLPDSRAQRAHGCRRAIRPRSRWQSKNFGTIPKRRVGSAAAAASCALTFCTEARTIGYVRDLTNRLRATGHV